MEAPMRAPLAEWFLFALLIAIPIGVVVFVLCRLARVLWF